MSFPNLSGYFIDKSKNTGNIAQTVSDPLYLSYKIASTSGSALLNNVRDMSNVLMFETDRLNQKKQSIDTALSGQKRIISLNDSYRQRYSAYTDIIITAVITLTVIIAISIIGNLLSFLPSFIFDLLSIVTFLVGFFICYNTYLDINKRSNMNFNELKLDPPSMPTAGENQASQANAASLGDLLGSVDLNLCKGSICCDNITTVWDSKNTKCVAIKNVAGFTTMEFSYDSMNPASPNEFEQYSDYKNKLGGITY